MEIQVYGQEDVKKSGGFKKKNNVRLFTEKAFKDYVKSNNLKLKKGYIDDIGYLSNDKRFRCFYNNLIIGVTKIIWDINKGVVE